jgi:excisionase family DNA binding protein
MNTQQDELLTVAEVAERVKLSEDRVRTLIREGAIPGTRLGETGHLRVHAADLEELLRPRGRWMSVT